MELEDLKLGKYQISEDGILKEIIDKDGDSKLDVVFPQKIYPNAIIHNITTENEKLSIKFLKGKTWREITAEKSITANKNKIIELANKGIAVNSLNSGALVNYLSTMENINYDQMPKYLETSQLGWYKDKFLPYSDEIQLCEIGGLNASTFKEKGSFDKWLEATNIVRKNHKFFRMILASEFASPLLKITGTLGSITHLWGATGTGKTVALMCGASVWGLPANDDGIIVTFNSTKVGFEILCDYLQNLPLNIDELETSNKSNNDDIIYLITEGKGKIRGRAGGGLSNIGKWKLWGISTGEHPITTDTSKGGALNRIINLQATNYLINGIDDINELCSVWRNNYGFAGKMFIDYIKTLNKEELIKKYNQYLQQFIKTGGTGKQSMAGAMLMLADELANDCIFKDNLKLTINDFAGIILSEDEVSRAERYHDMLFDWIAEKMRHFDGSENVDQWGKLIKDGNAIKEVRIVKTVIDREFFREIQSKPILCDWKKKGYIIGDKDGNPTQTAWIDNIKYRCVCIPVNKDSNKNSLIPIDDGQLPF